MNTALRTPLTTASTTVLEARGLGRRFPIGEGFVTALEGVDFALSQGEKVALMGPSGCGKSTLLALLGGLDTPSSGEVWVNGAAQSRSSEAEKVSLRRGTLGFIFQGYDLLPFLSVQANVEYPLLTAGVAPLERAQRARELLEAVGLSGKENALPEELSGGQQQRVGIARCLVTNPSIVLADEPTGNLDLETTNSVLELLFNLLRSSGASLVKVTHDPEVAAHADRILTLKDGRMVGETLLRENSLHEKQVSRKAS